MVKKKEFFFFSILIIFSILISLNFVSAGCWQYVAQSTCESTSDSDYCKWKNDSWSSLGWCEELNCWSLYSQSECSNAIIPGKNCTWQGGGTTYGCEKISCWSFSGTNANSCANNSAGLSCQWSDYCFSTGYSSNANCWNYSNQSSCLNATGCSWGQCMEKGCWSYNTSASCLAEKDWKGKNCTWDSSRNYCSENGCWKYGTNMSALTSEREAECRNTTITKGLGCEWKWNSCQDVDCWTWDFTNATACLNNSWNLSCSWSGSYCMKQDCWNYNSQTTCQNQSNCIWKAFTSSGWCQEVNCWTWDSMNSGNETTCVNNSYGLSCSWTGNPPGNTTGGWCYKNIASVSCSNFTTERACMDTYYCWWQFTDWNNPNSAGSCKNPGSVVGISINTTISKEWNPGCYIFDTNATNCNNTIGCNYTSSSKCEIISGHGNANEISNNGINCTMINSSGLCNNIAMLSSCCSWQNGSCVANKLSTSCREQMTAPPAGASFCEDYSSYENENLCSQIARDPWYMPCRWDNSTSRCKFKASDIFGNDTQSLMKIDNKMHCESAGGKWITENYCEGNASVPSGRCEYKFDEEDNCDKACFACEIKDSNGNAINASNAKFACEGSKLGYCEFSPNTNAQNGIGYCEAKEEFKKGVAVSCDENCGDCTYKGDSLNNDTTKRPSYYCITSKANSDGGGCKWVADNYTKSGGYCVKKGEKICQDSCDRCYTQSDCQNIGRTSIANQSGSCKWQGDSNTGSCVFNIGEDVEICWDGIDNTDDGLVDCSDLSCYADSYCGFVSGDCFGWLNNASCIEHSCEWIVDKWGSWCDFKGGQCWKYNQNLSVCNVQSNCQWNNGTGNSWCEQDWSRSEVCMGLNRTNCLNSNSSGCNWTADSWCQGGGNSSEWCRSYGGWCEYEAFKPKNCWSYNSGSSECANHTGCSWRTDSFSQPHCEINQSVNCWNYNDNSSCTSSGCWWRSDTWGSWCINMMDKCWSSTTLSSCESQTNNNGNKICNWNSWAGGGGGSCQPSCYNQTNSVSQSNCSNQQGCVWKQENGWCEEAGMFSCSNSTNMNNQTFCLNTTGCRWKNPGWCDPKTGGFSSASIASGGGMGGAIGADCYRYDGNQSLCTNRTIINISCAWFPEPTVRCEVDWSKNCWQYSSVETGCNSTNGCWFKSDVYGSSCMNIMDQCWSNQTLKDSPVACNATNFCVTNEWGGCEPKCSSQNSSNCVSGFLQGKCKWVTGWCNPSGMNDMFDGMEAGASAPLGFDNCSEGIQKSVDICGFGIKDMGDAYGFGVNVNDFSNASICNKEKLSSSVMGMVGGAGMAGGGVMIGGFGAERVGSGNDSVIFLVYLDTDGQTTGGCALSHNSSVLGYEFRFKYTSQWNVNTSNAKETFNAYKCDNSDWKAVDIKLSAWKKLMCSEIGGPMIAVEKADLVRFPLLYNSTKDIRVYVASIGNTGNVSSPSDTAGPGWTTPGTIDFDIKNAFDYGTEGAKFEDILKKGFVKGEDCFNSIDDDNDGSIDCNDWDCQYSSKCSGAGINVAGYADTSTPQVTGVKIEEYTDSALIIYDTNKPTNGTLELYNYGDTRCLNRSYLIYDVGILNSNLRQYKTWHYAIIYDDNSSANISLNWPLANGSTYNYKLKVCDSSGKCAVSKCSSFKTAGSLQKCGYCNFVTRIKVPSTWVVSYDVDRNGSYEHIQGQVCGPNAGMKTNYTQGRKVNIKLAKSDGSVYFEFLNASLTKTGLNDKVRTISSSGNLIADSSKAGLSSNARDKIINNLHPEVCRVKIPIPSGGICDRLYHCDDEGNNCVERTSAATLLDPASCVWQIPYCEFSTYKTSTPSGGTISSSGGGGGGGGGAGIKTYSISESDLKNSYTQNLTKGDKIKFNISAKVHYLAVDDVSASSVRINLTSSLQQATLSVGEEKKFELTDDEFYDISVKLNSILNKTASISIKSIHEEISKESAVSPQESVEQETVSEEEEKGELVKSKKGLNFFLIFSVVVIVLVIGFVIYIVKKKRSSAD